MNIFFKLSTTIIVISIAIAVLALIGSVTWNFAYSSFVMLGYGAIGSFFMGIIANIWFEDRELENKFDDLFKRLKK